MKTSWKVTLPRLQETPAIYRTRSSIISPSTVYEICSDLATLSQEAGIVIDVNTKNKIIDKRLISLGCLDSCILEPREIFKGAVTNSAASIFIVHNHPSGDASPSPADIILTRKLVQAGYILGIKVIDHVIIGRGDNPFCSLRETGCVNFNENTLDSSH